MIGAAPFGIMFRYFGLRYLGWLMVSIIGLASTVTLIQAIELARRASTKLQDGQSINIVGMSLLNLPSVIELTLPIALIAGSMLCFETWNRSNEFIVSRGFGRSIWAILSPASCSAGIVGLLFVALVNPIGSLTSREYEARMGELFGSGQQRLSVSADGIWLRDTQPRGQFIINGDMLDVETARIINPMIYSFNADNALELRIQAHSMQLTDTGWMIEGATLWTTEGERSDKGMMMMPSGLAALDLGLSSEPPNTIAFVSLPAFIKLLESAGLPTIDHRMHFHKLLSLPFLMIGLAMLSARATLTNMSRGRRARLFTRGIIIAVSVFLFSHFMQVLGTSLRLPAIVAAWAPAIIVTTLGAILLARMDEA
ncbi:MAG: LptF/LptG family permease [Candidatus Puniceispirillaceae bacterium]